MKKEKEVRVFEVKYYCECGEKYWLNEIYPVIKYKEVN